MNDLQLIALYLYVCERYEKELQYEYIRFSNNNNPEFTDEEGLTIYLYAMSAEDKRLVTQVHCYADKYLRSYFPKLPSYQAFNNRLNNLSIVMQRLLATVLQEAIPKESSATEGVVDSLPIMTCSAKRKAKVARELTAKGYCSTKDLYYYGVKLHLLGMRREGTLPWPKAIVLSSAAENDLRVMKENISSMCTERMYGDKMYNDPSYFEATGMEMLTPVKAVKGKPEVLRQRDKAAEDLYSTAVSVIRQPVEALFSWLLQKVQIQTASKVRSTKGLLLHIFGKLTAAFLPYILNP